MSRRRLAIAPFLRQATRRFAELIDMKIAWNIARVVVAIIVVLAALQMFASEVGEVVVITTHDAAGAPHRTRVWVVDHDGAQWIRAGSDRSGWFTRLEAQPALELERGTTTGVYRAVVVPAATAMVNGLMASKYGWADWYVGTLFPRNHAVVMRLEPLDTDPALQKSPFVGHLGSQ